MKKIFFTTLIVSLVAIVALPFLASAQNEPQKQYCFFWSYTTDPIGTRATQYCAGQSRSDCEAEESRIKASSNNIQTTWCSYTEPLEEYSNTNPNSNNPGPGNTNNPPPGPGNTNNPPPGPGNTNNPPPGPGNNGSGSDTTVNPPPGPGNNGSGSDNPPPVVNPPPGPGNTTSNCNPQTQLCNPLQNKYGTLCQVLIGLLTLITEIGAVIAVLLIIWTGFKFIVAQGNPAKLTEAKRAFFSVLIGTAILLGASGIANIVVRTVFSITNQDNPGVCRV
jgi:hypothetical protein